MRAEYPTRDRGAFRGDPHSERPNTVAEELDRLIQLDEEETARQTHRVAFLSLTAAVIEALPDALIVVDVEGKIVLVNERTEFMFGYPRVELIGRPVEMLMPARIRQIHTTHRREYNLFNLSPHARTMGLGLKLIALRCDGLEFPTEIMLARMVVSQGIYNLALIRGTPRDGESALARDRPPNTQQEIGATNAG
jgi:PAS domain S-box-containing protein